MNRLSLLSSEAEKRFSQRTAHTAGDGYKLLEAQIYAGAACYAITGDGNVFRLSSQGSWRPATLPQDAVISRSVTRETGRIRIKQKYL